MSSPVQSEALAGFPDLRGSLLEGRYRVGEALGVGGMGAVFEAEHVRLGRKVALKVMRPLYMQYRHHVARFLKEARAASQVKHPNVVEILDVGETPDGTVYTVMEFLDGEDLASILRREGRLPWIEAHGILSQVVKALEAAHEQGVIHRDVKPANCILVAGRSGELVVKMVDFGIAKFQDEQLSESDPLTKTGEVIGTPAYMAPELSLGREANARTDIYSVGVLAYQILTGERPFSGATAVEMHLNQTTKPPRSPRSVERTIPVGVENLILQMLAVTPGDRPLNMTRVAKDLQSLTPRMRATLSMTDFSRMQERGVIPRRIQGVPSMESAKDATIADGPMAADESTLTQPSVDGVADRLEDLDTHQVDRAGEGGGGSGGEPKQRPLVSPPDAGLSADEKWQDAKTNPVGGTVGDTPEDRTTVPLDPTPFRERLVEARPGAPQLRGKRTLPMGSVPQTQGAAPWPPEPAGASEADSAASGDAHALASASGSAPFSSGSGDAHALASASGSAPFSLGSGDAHSLTSTARYSSSSSSSGESPAVPIPRSMSASSSMPQVLSPASGVPVTHLRSSSSSIPVAPPRRTPPPSRWSVVLLVVLVVVMLAGSAAAVLWWPQIMALLGR